MSTRTYWYICIQKHGEYLESDTDGWTDHGEDNHGTDPYNWIARYVPTTPTHPPKTRLGAGHGWVWRPTTGSTSMLVIFVGPVHLLIEEVVPRLLAMHGRAGAREICVTASREAKTAPAGGRTRGVWAPDRSTRADPGGRGGGEGESNRLGPQGPRRHP